LNAGGVFHFVWYRLSILTFVPIYETEEVLANTIDEAFTYGYTFQPTLKIHFPGIYIGFSYSYFSLYARETL